MKNFVLTVFLFLLLPMSIFSSERQILFHLGGYFGLNVNNHIGSFSKLSNEYPNCCPRFESGMGTGIALGGLFEKKVDDKFLWGLKFGFSQLDGIFQPKEIIGNSEFRKNTPPYDTVFIAYAEVEHYLSSKIYTIGAEAYLLYNIFDRLNSNVGLRLAYTTTKEFSQYEKLIKPDNVTFLEGTRKRNEYYNQAIPKNNNMQLFGLIGINYDLPIGKNSYLTPSINFYIPFTNISDVDWKVNTFQFTLSVKFPIYEARPIDLKDTILERDTTVLVDRSVQTEFIRYVKTTKQTKIIENDKEKIERTIIKEHYERVLPRAEKLDISFDVFGVIKDGTRTENPTLVIEEIETEEGFPLLPYVFFPNGESKLETTKMKLLDKQNIDKFSEKSLEWNTLEIYYNLLNIIGYRLKNNTNANILLTGTNNNTGIEQNNLQISQERAEAVKKYLVDIWGIAPQRISTQATNLPTKPTSPLTLEGIQENSRVEISSNDNSITAPVYMKEIDVITNPPVIEIRPLVQTTAGVRNYELKIMQNEQLIRSYSGNGRPEKFIWETAQAPLPKLEQEAVIKFTVWDNINQQKTYEKRIAIQQKTIHTKREIIENDYKIERYSLILFDFDKSTILDNHKPVLNHIKTKIKPNSKVRIYGYADRTGTPEYNRELARRRCEEVKNYLKINPENVELFPIGNDELIFDNDLPEGRSYSRTVKIEIKTPIF